MSRPRFARTRFDRAAIAAPRALRLVSCPVAAPAAGAPLPAATIVTRVRAAVALLPGKQAGGVDVGSPLAAQGADELTSST